MATADSRALSNGECALDGPFARFRPSAQSRSATNVTSWSLLGFDCPLCSHDPAFEETDEIRKTPMRERLFCDF
jgi:hypothetical protein